MGKADNNFLFLTDLFILLKNNQANAYIGNACSKGQYSP